MHKTPLSSPFGDLNVQAVFKTNNRTSLTCKPLVFKPFRIFLFLSCFGFFLNGCIELGETYPALPPGTWRAVLKIDPQFISANLKESPSPIRST